MAFPIRSLDELSRSVRGAIRQYLPGTDASLRQNVLYVIGKVLALLAHEYELRLAWLHRQMFLFSADDPAHIRAHAADYRIFQKAASPATGAIEGTGSPNTAYPAGVRFLSGGNTYVTTAGASAAGNGAIEMTVVAEQSGSATNRDWGAVLTLADPALYPGLSSEFTVAVEGLGGGADRESVEALKTRALARKAHAPQGGSLADYERWALEVPGVTRAWAFRFPLGAGTIGLYFLFDGRANGIPEAADRDVVQAAIDARRMIRVDFRALAPTPVALDVEISGLVNDSVATRGAIAASIKAMLDERARPALPDDPFYLSRSWISEAISRAIGEDRHVLVTPAADMVFAGGGALVVPGTITYA